MKGKLLRFLKTLLRVRRARFDAAIILHSNWRKNLACLLAGIPLRCAANGAFANRRLNVGQRHAHVLDTARRLVEAATGADPGPLRCSIPGPVRGASEQALALCASGSWAVIHPFSGNPKRNFPLASWKPLLAGLAARGLKIFINASPAEKELFLSAAGAAVPLAFSCDSAPGLRDLAYFISKAKIFIGNNSGPLHLASALGTPCVGFYEKCDVPYIEPRGTALPRLLIFENSPEEITAEAVAAEINKVLQAGN
jgi:ADP-heptose:LPS heptosyltransferase